MFMNSQIGISTAFAYYRCTEVNGNFEDPATYEFNTNTLRYNFPFQCPRDRTKNGGGWGYVSNTNDPNAQLLTYNCPTTAQYNWEAAPNWYPANA